MIVAEEMLMVVMDCTDVEVSSSTESEVAFSGVHKLFIEVCT